MREAIRAAIVDDHPLFRTGLTQVLGKAGRVSVVATGSSASDAVRIAEESLPDVMLVDFDMPGRGDTAVREIARRAPGVKLIMLTAADVGPDLVPGAHAYASKGIDGRDLVRLIEAVCSGKPSPGTRH